MQLCPDGQAGAGSGCSAVARLPSVSAPPTDLFYLWREARRRDPDGYDVRLCFAGDNRLDPPWKLRDR